MKKITFALLSMFFVLPCMANIHINPDAVTEVVAKHFPKKQVECIREYNTQLKASNGSGIAASKLWNVCAAGGLDVKQPADKEKCRTFVNELTSKGTVKFYAACGKDKSMTGAVCVNDFSALVVNMQQAQGLAKLYARSKSDNTIQCRTKPRMDVQTFHSTNIHAMGMSSTTNTPYVQCTSYNSNKFYEFRFSSTDGNIDATNHKNFKTGICKIFGYKYVSKKPEAPADNHQFDICDGIKDESACNKLDQVISAGNIGYVASWGPLGYKTGRTGYQITGRNFPYCVLSENVAKGNDGYLLFERTAFGLDGRVFLKAGIQRKGSAEIKKQIRSYVENTMGKENVKSFSCEDTYHTVKLKDRSGKDDMLRCTVNDQVVEFFFDDLSESWGTYDKSGREAMNCIAWGGTFTGKTCIGLDEQMCNVVRDANKQACPECKLITWNTKTKICELPASVSATNLKKGLNYTAIVGGAVVGVVITVGTMGAATAPTALILTGLAVETLGAGIELQAQIDIDRTADKFFTQSANCNDARCATDIILEYLKTMSNQQNDMLEEELSAADSELARLADLIPADADFYQDLFNNGATDLAGNETGEWTPAQVWRAIGIGMQSISVLTGVGKWIIKKSPALQKGLQKTTIVFGKKGKILRNARQVALTNSIDYDKLDDVGKEWYNLWKQYAPNNQTFDEFKAMTNGNLDEMKQMAKNWKTRAELEPLYRQLDEMDAEFTRGQGVVLDLMDKYGIETLPNNPDELAKIYKQYPDLEKADKALDNIEKEYKRVLSDARNASNYSTFDPEASKMLSNYRHTRKDLSQWYYAEYDSRYQAYLNRHPNGTRADFMSTKEYKNLTKEFDTREKALLPDQWQIAEQVQLKNLDNIVNERVDAFNDVLADNPEIRSKLQTGTWLRLTKEQKNDVVQQLADAYAEKLGTPKARVILENLGLKEGGHYETGSNIIKINTLGLTNNNIGNTLTHEYGHYIDYITPNNGALGEQYYRLGEMVYSSKPSEGYRIALTEQSSFAIGNATKSEKEEIETVLLGGAGVVGGEYVIADHQQQDKNKGNKNVKTK